MALFSIIAIVEAVTFSLSSCFESQNLMHSKKTQCGSKELDQLSQETRFTINELEALYELFKKLSSPLTEYGWITKEELQLALLRTRHDENLLFERIFDIFDEKRNGVIDFEEFVHSLNVFHPHAPVEEKIDFAFKLYDLKQTGFIEREEVKQMIIAILSECDMTLSDELVEQIIHKTFVDADADKDGKLNREDWKAFVMRNPSLLRNMTLPCLKDITIAFPSFAFNTKVED